MFKYLWEAVFEDGHKITQPQDDRYSKHVEGAEHNPSSFRDLLDYAENVSPLAIFSLHANTVSDSEIYAVNLLNGEFFVNGTTFTLDQPMEELIDRKVIYYRTKRMDMTTQDQYIYAYNFGYEGKHPESGKIVKRIITVL